MSLPPRPPAPQIAAATTPEDVATAVVLFRAYAASLSVDLAYQNSEAEMQAMPGADAPPAGALLLARDADGSPLGAVALRPMAEAGHCEMKRLYVARRAAAGAWARAWSTHSPPRRVASAIGRCGWTRCPTWSPRRRSTAAFGFEVAAPYYVTPVAGTAFMRRVLG